MSEVPLLTPLNYIHSSQQTAPSSKSTTAPSHAQKKTTHTLPVSKALPKTDILKHTYFSFSMEETLKYEYVCKHDDPDITASLILHACVIFNKV